MTDEARVKLLVQGRHLEVTDALRGYTQLKVERLSRFFATITKVDVVFEAAKDTTYTAKVIVGLPRNHTIVCSERERSLTAALDLTVETVERKLKEFKDRLQGKGHREKVTRRLRSDAEGEDLE
jgi:putative sigma-54 modulation protein